ncbi:MAG: L,D-transpeptidase family protein [Pseudomonadota bacterium]|nr:L,D-transpeptidase family protein [Pseudomonadota bacterium]
MLLGTVLKGWSPRPAGRFARPAGFAALALLSSALSLSPAQSAQTSFEPVVAATGIGAAAIAEFYDARGNTPIWLAAGQTEPAHRLMTLLATSDLDGLRPAQFNIRALQQAVRRAESGDRADVARADRMLSEAFLRYVAALRRVGPSSEWQFIDRAAAPPTPQVGILLRQAAATGSLNSFLDRMPWMHEGYSGLRSSLAEALDRGDEAAAARLRLNLDRIRLLPASGRYVLVNTAAQRLYMYEDGKVVDSMRVVVGKPTQPTPMMAAMIRYTAVNPYWNVPPDLAAERIAPNVVEQGVSYLKRQGYVVLSDWSDDATPVDPSTIDWKAVADGTTQIRVRQKPGPGNAMGRMKFMFPNKSGIYLHDTPNKELLLEDARLFSGGCVRLEDAPRLAEWLYGEALKVQKGGDPEQHVDLEQPVPVYLAYLTAVPSDSSTVFYDDIYGRDQARLAATNLGRVAAR